MTRNETNNPSGVPDSIRLRVAVAELLRLPERTLEDWRLTCQGPPYLKLGRHVRYELADVIAWTKAQRHG